MAEASAPTYTQIASLALYELSSYGDAGLPSWWAGYLPSARANFGPTATLTQVWQDAGGVYLFLGEKPADEPAFAAFLAALLELLPRLSPRGDLRMLWIANALDPSANWGLQLLRATASGSGQSIAWNVSQQAQFTLAEYALWIERGAALTEADAARLGYGIAVTAADVTLVAPGMGYSATDGSTWLPFAGPSVGSWRAQVVVPTAPGVDGLLLLGVAVRYGAPADNGAVGDQVETLDMAVLQQGDDPVRLYLAYDPLNPLVPERSRLGFFADDGSGTAPVLGATFRTSRGYETEVTPKVAAPPLRSARLVFCRTPLQVTESWDTASWTYHLAPDGAFDLAVVPPKDDVGFDPTRQRLMLGLSGLEYAMLPEQGGALVFFDAGREAYAPSAAPNAPPPAPAAPLLDGFATTAYATVVPATPGPAGLPYYAQPKQAPLYTGGGTIGTGFLQFAELPAGALSAWSSGGDPPATLPAAPFAGAASVQADLAHRIENAALAPLRRAGVPVQARPSAPPGGAQTAVTPQGLLVEVTGDRISSVVIANMPRTPQAELDFTSVGDELQAALLANELFFVVADPGVFMDDSSVRYRLDARGLLLAAAAGVPQTVIDALKPIVDVVFPDETEFEDRVKPVAGTWYETLRKIAGFLKAELSGWTFQLSPRSWRTQEDGAPTMMLAKFCGRSLEKLVAEPAAWAWPEAGALPNGGRAATRDALMGIFEAARERASDPNLPVDDPYAAFYRQIVSDASWNGFLFLNAPVSIAELPRELQFVTAGIEPERFFAHHVGFNATPIDTTGGEISLRETAAFGLIDYQDPVDLVLPGTVPFAFKTLAVTARFANAAIAGFSARVELMTNELFGSELTKIDPTHGNNLVLAGSYQVQAGTPSYAFVLEGQNLYATVGAMLASVDVTGVRLLTAAVAGAAETVTTTFVLAGNLRFAEPVDFDPYCYGPETLPDGSSVDGWLRFDGVAVTMEFPLADPSTQTFAEKLTGISFDLANSKARSRSLVANFPLTLTGLVAAPNTAEPGQPPQGQKPEDMDYASVAAKLRQTPLQPPWFGLVYTLDLGSLGALSGSRPLTLTLLAGWGIGTSEEDMPAYLGLKLPGGRGTSIQWPLQGVLKLGFRSFQFDAADTLTGRAYQLRLRRFGLSLLGLSFPPGNVDVVLFGDPTGSASKVLGWYAAYAKDDPKKPRQEAVAAAATPHLALPPPTVPPPSAPGAERRLAAGRRSIPPSEGL